MGMEKAMMFLLMVHCLRTCMAATFTNFTDESALIAFRAHITSDPNNILATNWSEGTSFCNWIGISCSPRHQRVTSINLHNMGLRGTIPREIGNLSFLTFLDLSNNSFQGNLPSELGLLTRLKSINLQFNQLDGNIPNSLGNLTKLEELYLDNNNLDGPIPNEITHLLNLEVLALHFNRLSGTIPQAIFNISALRFIRLTYNSLHGTLPMDMCNNLPKLTELHLSWNQLTGQLPRSLANCTELQVMSLVLNNFTGSINEGIGELSKLKVLYLDTNDFSGTIPTSFGNLSLLEELDIAENRIHGNIPRELGQLVNLIGLRLSLNNLTGEIPKSLFNMSKLEFISVVDNQLSGTLPSTLGLWLPNLETIYLGRNKLSGIIPSSISNASKLIGIELSQNSFNGNVPRTLAHLGNLEYLNFGTNQLTNDPSTPELDFLTLLTNCRHLKTLGIENNRFMGVLPKSMGNLSVSLEGFYATNCGIEGTIPVEIGNLSNLVVLALGDNNFEGPIPRTVGQLWKLQQVQISKSAVEGSIPSEICSLTDLGRLLIMENKIHGPIPSCMGNLTSLRQLNLYSNGLTSEIPSSLWSLKDLIALNLSSNLLTGSLAPEVGNLMAVIQLELSRNQFTGNIPSNIGQLQKLLYLSLSRNRLEGSIPESFANLVSLEYLDLSENALSGIIPRSSEKLLYLKYLNVSFNKLSGEIPSGGPFVNFTAESFMSNDRLCGDPKFQVIACNGKSRGGTKPKVPLRYILPPIAAVAIAAAILIWFIRYRGKNNQLPVLADSPLGLMHGRISYYELLHATNNYSEGNLIGRGSLGMVFKGILSNGMVVAVKVFNLEIQGAFKSFDIECEVLRNIRHRNLVKVINSCSNLDFKALVLEYMPNGSLERWLYSDMYYLDIDQRLGIMIDVASALEYMHHGYSTSVVHCDLKPSNILLDEDMVAHVGDFGIAKLFTKNKLMTQTQTLGTIGYMAPEYGTAGIVSTVGDVYSYGILLMEIFTRKKPTDDMFQGELSLRRYVYEALPRTILEIVDANLLEVEERNFTAIRDCLSSIMGLALKCSVEAPEERIGMKDVLAKLEKIKTKLQEDITGHMEGSCPKPTVVDD